MEENKKIDPVLEAQGIKEEENSFDFRTIFTLVVLNWQWILLSMFIFICGALIYLRYSAPVYQLSAKILIKEERNNRYNSNAMLANMQELGFISNSTGIDNEIEILKSRVLALEVVKDLKLYVEYKKEGRISKRLIYKYQPINIDLDEEHLADLDKMNYQLSFRLTEEDNGTYRIKGKKNEFEAVITSLPAAVETPYGTLTFTKNLLAEQEEIEDARRRRAFGLEGSEEEQKRKLAMTITITSPMRVAEDYVDALNIAPTSKLTSIAELTLRDKSTERGYDFLKHLTICYNRQANADKNEIAVKTEEFINNRLEKINSELGITESELEDYKRRNNLTQLRLDATETMTQANLYYDQLVKAQTQLQILDDLRQWMGMPENKYQIIPSNVGLSDVASSGLIQQYNKTVLERNRLLASASENSPLVYTQTEALDQLEVSIREALRQARRTADIQLQGIEKQYRQFQSKIANTPEQERVLTQIGRQQEVMSGLYLLLLQKREENSISLAATADKGHLIDEPAYTKVSPKKAIILLAAFILGFALPLLICYLLQFLRYKIEAHEDVVKLTNLPIVADVAVASDSVKSAAGIVVHENQNDQIEEIFRSMRTNLLFMMKENDKVILFTSSTSGEGKTFNAANLAVSFALLGKKVILLGLDIRKPALGRLFDISDRTVGISTLLAKDNVSESDVISQTRPSGVNKNLDLLLAGPTPPNPTELLARKNMGDIINILQSKYDYIILDTAPVGLVTDTLQIAKHADVTAFVCRADYTPKSAFAYVNQLHAEGKLPNMSIVINGIDMSKKKYGYYYGYGRYGKYGRYGRYGRYGSYGSYGNYAESHYGKKEDNSIKK